MQGKLTICPTPLGNLGDITQRTIAALEEADTICAEDTRVTGKLLAALGIEGKRLERLDENLIGERADQIVARVQAGETIAYCSDAGMPGVSDPGLRLVRSARHASVETVVLPGPTAVATAFVASGCNNATFYFGGFFPRKETAKTQVLKELSSLDAALIFYESPNRLLASLKCIAVTFPFRTVSICRELTKLHEEVLTGTPLELLQELSSRDSIKGEIVLVIEGPTPEETAAKAQEATQTAEQKAKELLAEGLRPKDVSKAIAKDYGISRNDAYKLVLALQA